MPETVPLRWFVLAVFLAIVSFAFGLWSVAEDRRLRRRAAQDRRRAQALREEAEQQLAGAAAEAKRLGNIAAQEQWQSALKTIAAERDRALQTLAAEREHFQLREEELTRALNAEATKVAALERRIDEQARGRQAEPGAPLEGPP